MFGHGETVVRLRRKLVADPYSQQDTLGDWSDPDRLPIAGVAVAPSSSFSVRDATRSQVSMSMSVYAPAGSDVQPGDRIEAASGVWLLDGAAMDWANPFTGTQFGVELQATRVVG